MYRFFLAFAVACAFFQPAKSNAQAPRCDVFFQSITGEICSRSVTASVGYLNSHERFFSSGPFGFGSSFDTRETRRQSGALANVTWSPFSGFEIGVGASIRNQTIGDAGIINFGGFSFLAGTSEQSAHSITSGSAMVRYEVWKGDSWGARHIISITAQAERISSYRSPIYLGSSPPTLIGVRGIKSDWVTLAGIRTSHTWDVGKGFSLTARALADVSHYDQSNINRLRAVGRFILSYAPFGLAFGPEYTLTTSLNTTSQKNTYQYAGARLYFSPAKLSGIAQLAPLVLELGAQKLVFEHSDRQMRITSGLGFFMDRPRLASTDFSATMRYRLEY